MRKFSNIDFFLQMLPLKDDELVMSEMQKKKKKKKNGGSPTSFWRELARKNTLNLTTVSVSQKILQLHL